MRQRARARLGALFGTRRTYTVTREGWAFVVVTLLIGLAALNTSAQLLFLVFALMCSFWTLSAVLATSSLRGATIEREAPWTATAGRAVAVRLRARNAKRAGASRSLRVTDFLENGTAGIEIGAAFFARVEAGGAEESEYRCVFPRRGQYRFRDVRIATRYPFGLIERTITRRLAREIVVLPPVVSVDRVLRAARVDLGDQEVNVKGRGAGLFGIRTYQQGEPARDIHWRVTARTGVLMTREYETEEKRRASILLDNRAGTGGSGESFEHAVVLAGSVASHLLERGHQVELVTAHGKVPFGTGPQHLRRCLRALALLEPSKDERQGPLAHEPSADSVQIVLVHRGDEAIPPDAVRIAVAEHRETLATAFPAYAEAAPEPAPTMGGL